MSRPSKRLPKSKRPVPAWRRRIDNPTVAPKHGRRIYDTMSPSPNSRATCTRCGLRIEKGVVRVGIQSHVVTTRGNPVWRPRYYHGRCVTSETHQKLHLSPPLPSSPPSPVKAASKSCNSPILHAIENNLRALRSALAKKKRCQEYKIFQKRTLQEILSNLPGNKQELSEIWGISAKRIKLFGTEIIGIVTSHISSTPSSQDTDSEVIAGPTLSVQDIVANRVRAAEARGEVYDV